MELVTRLPIEIVRLVYSYGSVELREQKEVYLSHVRTRLPYYIESVMREQAAHGFGYFFHQMHRTRRERLFKKVRQCCCCTRHMLRRPTHNTDGRILNFHNRRDEPECACACRYIMRRCSRAYYF